MPKYPKVNYIGNKEKLVNWIIDEFPIKTGKVLDIFAGGCSVSYALKCYNFEVISNDVLYADYVIAKALVENDSHTLDPSVFDMVADADRVKVLINKYGFLKNCLYYDYEIEELARLVTVSETLPEQERYVFLALLRRAMIRKLPYSRMNVPWNQIQKLRDEDYSYSKYKRKRAYHNQTFETHMRENIGAYNDAIFAAKPCVVKNLDAMDMAKSIDKVDVVYMDPPYPSTMNNYDSFYGMFDQMFDMNKEHMDFTQKSNFIDNMRLLISELKGKTKYIVLSQNTRVKPEPDIIQFMLSEFGKVTIKEKKHNYQVTGKDNKNSSKELLFIVDMEE